MPSAGFELFNRELVLNINGLRIASRLLDETKQARKIPEGAEVNILKVTFLITRTIRKDPNKLRLEIFNLKSDNRIALQERNQRTIVEAGYIDKTSVLFDGNLDYSSSVLRGRDWVTTLEATDGTKQTKSARINTSLKGPVTAKKVLRVLADALNVKPGNVLETIKNGSLRNKVTEFTNGKVLSGKVDKLLDQVTQSMGYTYSIQDGHLILIGRDQTVGTGIETISPATGLVGSPESGSDGFVNVRAMIRPNLTPGHLVRIESSEVAGFFRIERVDFSGDTWGNDWYADMECRPLKEPS